MKDFKELKVWSKSHEFVLEIYKITLSFPKEELYGLTSQIRRASISIPANIAEGCGRKGDAELARYFQIAMGSASEVEYYLILINDLNIISETNYSNIQYKLIEIKKMLNTFLQKLIANR